MESENEDFATLLAEYGQVPSSKRLKEGELIEGRVTQITQDTVFIDLGQKSEGLLERAQVLDSAGNLTVKVGDTVSARVVDNGAKNGAVILRRIVTKGVVGASELQMAYEHGIPVEGVVTGVNKGGYEVQVAGARGFCPLSQIDNRQVTDPQIMVGSRAQFRITKLEMGRGLNVVLSRRALLEEEAAGKAAEVRKTLAVGMSVRGTVSQIKEYGAFVDIGGLEGLLHVSELAFHRVKHPSELLTVGQPVEVQITKIEPGDDPKKGERISLSLKALEKDPWLELADKYPSGSRVRGKVTKFQPFGAFVEIEPGIEGLVHISQMATGKRINHPREVVDLGQSVEALVLAVDLEKRRISLSLALEQSAEDAGKAEFAAFKKESAPKSLGTFADLLSKKK